MRDFKEEIQARVQFIQKLLAEAGAKGIVFGNSGGKDSALVGILCKLACPAVLGVMLPCGTEQNYGQDMQDALALSEQYDIEALVIDLTKTKVELQQAIEQSGQVVSKEAAVNLAPRLRMSSLYAVAQSRGYLVAGTGNRSERYMGYYTKWGDGAFDFNPIADLTVMEVYAFLEFLKAPKTIIDKAPSAGLFPGQTDEQELGIVYRDLDRYLLTGEGSPEEILKYEKAYQRSAHKRQLGRVFSDK